MTIKSQGVNLLPSQTKGEIKKEKRKGQFILGTTGLTFLVSLFVAGLLFYNLYLQYKVKGAPFDFLHITGVENQINLVNKEIDKKEDILTLYTEAGTKLSFVKDILEKRPDYQLILNHAKTLIPDGMEITSYSVSNSGVLSLSGTADDFYQLAVFIKSLSFKTNRECYFINVDLTESTLVQDRVKFHINATAIIQDSSDTKDLSLGVPR